MSITEVSLCIEILSLSDKEVYSYSDIDKMDREIYQELNSNSLSREFLLQTQQSLDDPLDVIKLLTKIHQCLQFYPETINYLINSNTFYKKMPRFTLLTILKSYVAWTYMFSKTLDAEYFYVVLNSLNFLIDVKISGEYPELRSLGVYAFLFAIVRYCSLSKNPKIDHYILQIVDFFTINDSIPSQIYKIFEVIIASMLYSQEYDKQHLFNVLNSLSLKIRSKKEAVPAEILENILHQLLYLLQSFNTMALQFWAQTAQVLDDFQLASFFPQIIDGLLSSVDSTTILLKHRIDPCSDNRIKLKPLSNDYYVYYQNQNFASSTDITDYVTFSESKSLLECISPKLLNTLAIIEVVYIRSQVLSQKFIEVYAKKLPTYFNKDNALEQITLFYYICVVIFQSFPVYVPPVALWNNIVFSRKYTAFKPSEEYDFLNTFRQLTIKFLIEPQKCTCSYIFTRVAEYPLLFAEMVHRMIQYPLHKIIDPAKAAQLTVGLINILIQYRDMEVTEEIIRARKAVITFLIRCFRQKETAYAFFVNKDFLRKFFSLFLESALVKGISSIFFNYFNSSQKIDNIIEIVEIINEFVDQVFKKMPTAEGLKLLVQFMKELNEALMLKSNLVNYFAPLIELLCKQVINLDDTVDREDILIQVISLMAVTSHEHSIKIRELTAIEAAILKLNNNNPKNDIMIKLAQIIAKRPLSFVLPNFDIQQPNVLILFLRIYLKSEKLLDVIDFLISLCDFSPINCTKCHDGDLDIFIIDIIDQWRINGGISNQIVNRMLDLLLKIILVTASVSVMQKFFSLFCPIDGKHLPYYFYEIISTFNRALISINKNPVAIIPVDANSSLKVFGVNGENLNNGLTFSFWLYPIPNDVVTWKQYLFVCYDQFGHMIKVILQNRTIIVKVHEGLNRYKGTFELQYTNLMWQFITVSYRFSFDDDFSGTFICYLNAKVTKRLHRFPNIEFKGPVSIMINEACKNRPLLEKPFRIGQITLCVDLQQEELQSMADDGPRGVLQKPKSLVFAIEGSENNGNFEFVNKFSSDITIESSLKNFREDTRFSAILIDMAKIENIIPIFALIDLTDPQNEKIPYLLESFIDILKNVLLLGPMAQNYFVDANGFSIISHLLSKCDQSNLTYKIYLRFYDLLQVISRSTLQKQLYDEILLNVSLWIKCNPKNHLMILKHWARSIYDENMSIIEVKTFRWFLYILRRFYYFKPVDENFIIKDRVADLQVDDCRRSIYEVMTYFVNQPNFNDFDYKCLLFHAISTNDEEQALSLLSYLSSLIFSHETPIQFFGIALQNIKSLYKFIEEDHDAKVILTLNIISEIYARLPDKREKLQTNVIETMKLLKYSIATQSFFAQLISLMNGGFPEFFPLCVWSALNAGGNTLFDLIKQTKPHQYYSNNLVSLYWAIILLFKVDEKIYPTIFAFILTNFCNIWKEAYFLIQAIGKGFKVPNKTELLRKIFVQSILEKVDEKHFDDIIIISRHYLLFHPRINKFLENEFNDSKIFIETQKGKKREVISFKKPKSEELNLEDIFANIRDVKTIVNLTSLNSYADDKTSLSLNINNKDLKWENEEMTKRVLQILLKNPKHEYVNDVFILSYFIRKNQQKHSNVLFITPLDSIQALLQTKEEISFHDALVNRKSENFVLSPLFDFFASQLENSVQATCNGNIFIRKVYEWIFLYEGPAIIHNKFDQLPEIFWPELSHFEESANKELAKRRKNWFRLWRNVTADSAPWNSSLPAELRKVVRYKRDNKVCSFWCPMKLRHNYAFNDHMEASLTRDSGNLKLAKQKASQLREEAKIAHSSSSFLSIASEADENSAEIDDSSHTSTTPQNFEEMKQRYMCKVVTPKKETIAALVIRDQTFKIFCQNGKAIFIHFGDIKAIFQRTFRHIKNSIEIFTLDGDDYFIRFKEKWQQESIVSFISVNIPKFPSKTLIQTLPFKPFFEASGLTEKWIKREISNFEYLMSLNVYSGRSFLATSQYPLFPWILVDFSSKELELNKKEIYRDLTKPVGALTEKRIDDIMKRYEEMQSIGMKPYMYGNGPVFPLSVFQYLIRMEPFTSLHIQIQGGRFDHAARLFISVNDCCRQTREQDGDFRELIPEFFFMSEFLENTNGFDLGKTDKCQLGDVVLPPWANNSKFEFIYKHRKALESDYVSEYLSDWIDLIWGYKQNNLESHNIYKKEMYYTEKRESDSAEIRSFLDHMGQIPQQLFDQPHPKRIKSTPMPTLITSMLIKDDLGPLETASVDINNNECYVRFLNTKNELGEIFYDLNNLYTDGCSSSTSFVTLSIKDTIAQEPSPCFVGRGIAFCSDKPNTVQLWRLPPSQNASIDIPSRIITMAGDQRWCIFCCEDAKVYVSKNDAKIKGTAISFKGEVIAVGFSPNFDIIVGATRDGSLIFWSLSRQTNARIVELGLTVLSIVVCQSMGYVIVHARTAVGGVLKYSLILFSINGEKIRETECKHLVCLVPWMSRDGFDFVLAADTNGNVFNFEAFWLNFPVNPIAHCGGTVLSMAMNKNSPAAIVITNSGKIFAIPIKY